MATTTSARRVDTQTSRTAEWTCLSRAASVFESNPHFHSNDDIAPRLLPAVMRVMLRTRFGRYVFHRVLAGRGMYEYVIARTRYIDAAFQQALDDGFDEIVLFGAGFDTRALRFSSNAHYAGVFELDVPVTQNAKIGRYRHCHLSIPTNLHFVAIDFDRESIAERLAACGFVCGKRCLFVLEGVLMYLQPASVDATFRTLQALGGPGSRVVFDYVRASVLRGEGSLYGQQGATQAVSKVNESWHFGLEPGQVNNFLSAYGFTAIDRQDSDGLEKLYFTDENGNLAGRVNGTHCIVTAERK